MPNKRRVAPRKALFVRARRIGASQKDPGKKMFTFSRPGIPAETVTGQP